MNLKIIQSEDPKLIARLNRDVQTLHHEIEPNLFKPFSLEALTLAFAQMLNDPVMLAFVAYVDEIPAAYIVLCQRAVEENAFRYAHSVLHIDQVCVDGKYKGQGIGKALINFAKQHAKENQIYRIEMNYWSKNNHSGEFFQSQGFTIFNERLFFTIE